MMRTVSQGFVSGLVLALAFAFLGCSDDHSASGASAQGKVMFIDQMAPSDVFAVVNGRKLTKQDYLDYRVLAESLYRVKKGLPASGDNQDVSRYMRMIERTLPSELISRQLMLDGAEKAGVLATAEDRENAGNELLFSLKRPFKSVNALARKIGPDAGKLLLKVVGETAQIDAFRRQSATNDIMTVSESEIKMVQDRLVQWNANADRLNAKSRKKAMRFREAALKPGADFEKLTHQHAKVSPEFGKFWESFQLGELDDGEPLKLWLATAKEGDLSEPIDLDDGIAIVKLLKKTVSRIPGESTVVIDFDLARCTFRAYQHLKEQTAEELATDIRNGKIREAQKELGTKLWEAAVFEYPHGEQFFPSPEEPKKESVKGKKQNGRSSEK